MNRRKFLGVSALAGVGAMVVPEMTMAKTSAIKGTKETFPTRKLGKTGLEIPILSMGVMRADNPAVLRAAYNSGIRHFDTANGYQKGRNEEMVGEFFKDKDRSSFTIATKGKADLSSDTFETDYDELLATSLRRLQMDYVDIYFVHGVEDVGVLSNPRLINVLKKFKDSGKVRHIGFSTHANKPEQIDEAIKAGIYEVCLISYNFKIDILPKVDEAIQRGVDAGMGFMGMKSMAGGVEDATGKKNVDGAACLRWVWQNPNITTVIPGFTSFDLLDNCLEAAHRPGLDDADKKYLASLSNNELLYCQNCEKCVSDCSKHLPIPTMMRAYMYNYGYKQPLLSKDTLMDLALNNSNVCADCSSCTVKCPSGFNVANKIAAITPIINVSSHFLT